MLQASKIVKHVLVFGGSLLFGASLLAMPANCVQDQQNPPPKTARDNSKMNRDHQSKPTADQQKMNASDQEITRKIREAIHDDDSLSMYAHNIKIITQDGKVTLRGPVKSMEEKTNVEAKAVAVVGQDNVTNEITVSRSK
ncbi:MAG: BON domain-containing protein [Candidatus Acidiferrales bacterium]